MPKTNGKLSAQQSNEICSGANDRLGIQREAKNELVFSKSLRFVPLHLTWLFELRKSCWEICDSQQLWKSQFSEVFTGLRVVFSKLVLVFEEMTCRLEKVTWCLCNFVGHFSDFFPWNFENVRQNWENIWQNRGKVGENCRMLPFFKIRERERRNFLRLLPSFFSRRRKNLAFFELWL